MKYLLVGLALVAMYPIGRLARTRATVQAILAALVGLMPFVGIDQLDMDLWGVAFYRGESMGFEITVVDLLVVGLYFSLPDERSGPIPYRIPRWFYLAALVFSIGAAAVPLYSWFSLWKLVRAYFLFAVVFRAVESDARVGSWLLTGFCLGVFYSLGTALFQRYVEGYYQVTGDFDHQNSLGMAVNLVFPLAWAVVLAGQGRILGTLTLMAAGVILVMTLSRGAMAMFGVATLIVLAGTFLRGVTKWKVIVLALMVLTVGVVLAKSWDSITDRFATAPEGSMDARERFENAAAAMLEDAPLGIGVNQYSHMLANEGYAEEFGMPLIDRDGLVHNIYWLTLTEMGHIGLIAYILLILAPWWTSLRGLLRYTKDIRGDVMLGCFAGMTAMYLHGQFEWVARQTPQTYLFFAVAAIAAAYFKQLERERLMVEAFEEAARAIEARRQPRRAPRVELGDADAA